MKISVEGNFTLDDAFWSQKLAKMPLEAVESTLAQDRSEPEKWLHGAGVKATEATLLAAASSLAFQPASTLQHMAASVVDITGAPAYLNGIKNWIEHIPLHLVAGERTADGWHIPDWVKQQAASYQVIKNCGHLMMLEDGQQFSDAITAIIEKAKASQGQLRMKTTGDVLAGMKNSQNSQSFLEDALVFLPSPQTLAHPATVLYGTRFFSKSRYRYTQAMSTLYNDNHSHLYSANITMRQFHCTPTPFALAAFLLASAAAQAQTAPAADTAQALPTVVVNASADASAEGLSRAYAGGQVARGGRVGILGSVDMMDSPFGSTSYTQQFISDQQARSIGDLLQSDPAVRLSRGYGNFQEVYVIRGFALNSDDIAYNGLYGVLPRQYVSPELLERVEVFRGASAFLNGAAPGGSGLGGAINLMPKRAGNTPLTEVTVGVESGGHTYVATDIARRFGDNQEFGVRVNAAKRQGETSIKHEDHDVGMFSVGLDYRGHDYRLSADAGYQNFDLTTPRPSVNSLVAGAIPAAPDASSNFAQPWSFSKEHDVFGTVRGEYDLASNVTAWAAFGSRSTHESNSLAQPTVTSLNGDASVYRFDNARKQQIRTGELGVRAKLNTGAVKHTLVASWSGHWNEDKNAYAISDFAGLPTNIYQPVDVAMPPTLPQISGGDMSDPRITQKTILTSFAVADTMAFLEDSLLLTVGLRHQQIRDAGYAYGTAAPTSYYDQSANTPVAGIVYKLDKSVSLYANYIEALVKGPTASGTDANGDVVSNLGQVFAPYKARQKEVGLKYDGGKLGASAALFSTSVPLQAVRGTEAGLFGQQRNQGVELSVFGMPANGVRLLGGLTWLDTKQSDTGVAGDDGKKVIGAPQTQLSFGAEWDVPGAPGLSLNARTIYTSTQYADLANTRQLPSWTRLDLGARYLTRVANHDVTIRARVDNVANRNYWASAVSSFGAGSLVLASPRTFVVSATVGF